MSTLQQPSILQRTGIHHAPLQNDLRAEYPEEAVEDSRLAAVSHTTYEKNQERDDYDSEKEINSGNSQQILLVAGGLVLREASTSGKLKRKRSALGCETNSGFLEVKRLKFFSASAPILKHSICSEIPVTIWAYILSFLHPADLGRQRHTCRLFHKCLDNQTIWRRSRKLHLPDHPRPVFGLAEWQMLSIIWGSDCMVCEDGINKRAGNTRLVGVKSHTSAYWPFRVRCCEGCLEANTTKEFSLLRSSSFPAALLNALPFGIVDLRNNWISNPTHYQPNIGLTKIFWNADISDILERYQEASDMGAQEEWFKGLEAVGLAHKLDLMRIEKFEKLKINVKTAQGIGTDYLSETSHRVEMPQKGNKDCTKGSGHDLFPHQCQWETNNHESAGAVSTSNIIVDTASQPKAIIEQHALKGFCVSRDNVRQQSHTVPVKMEHTSQELAQIRAQRRSDIEARCLRMIPPLKPELLLHMPAFQAAIKIAIPLGEDAWEILKKRLEQQAGANEYEYLTRVEWQTLQQCNEERQKLEQKQRDSEGRKENEWNDFQLPVRERLEVYADEIINSWVGRLSKETAPNFAVHVLNHCRRRFYEENPYSANDPYHFNPLDTTTRAGRATLEVPTKRRLTLENMKFVFDNKIKPSTDQFGSELFLCNGCEYNPRFYTIEGVIQHYAAKHTAHLSAGMIVVQWKADWPAKLPFHSDPWVVGTAADQTSNAFRPPQPKCNGSEEPCVFLRGTWSHHLSSCYGSSSIGHYAPNGTYDSRTYSGYAQLPQNLKLLAGMQPQISIQTHPIYLEQIAKDARVAWFQLSGIKDLPSSVRIHYVISKTMSSFQARFSCELPLPALIEALTDHASLKPVKNANGLHCLECYKNPPPPASDGTSRIGRLFTFSALLQHFLTIHVLRNRATVKPDWKTEMVKLPETRLIGMIRQAQGMDSEKYKLLEDVFTLAFSLPAPGKSVDEGINDVSALEDCTNHHIPRSNMITLEQKDLSPVNMRFGSSVRRNIHSSVTIKATKSDYQCPTRPLIASPTGYFEAKPRKKTYNCIRSADKRSLGRGYPTKSVAGPSGLNSCQDTQSCLARGGPVMSGAERFLKDFLRNTPGGLREEHEDNELRPTSTQILELLSSADSQCDDHKPEYTAIHEGKSELNKPPKYSQLKTTIPLGTDRYNRNVQLPFPRRKNDRYGHNTSITRKIVPSRGPLSRYLTSEPERLESVSRPPNHYGWFGQQPDLYPKDDPLDRGFAGRDIFCCDRRYPSVSRSHPYIKGDGSNYQDTIWSNLIHEAGPLLPLPPPTPKHSEFDYTGRAGSNSFVPLPPYPQYSRYLPPRSPIREPHRWIPRSPSPLAWRLAGKATVSFSVLPLRAHGSVEDHHNVRSGNSDRGYDRPRRHQRDGLGSRKSVCQGWGMRRDREERDVKPG